MRPITLFSVLLLIVNLSFAGSVATDSELSLYEKLCDVNAQWLTKDHSATIYGERVVFEHDEALIQTHLMLVEQSLRNADVSHLTATQQANRSYYLEVLHEYWMAGKFPQNLYHKERTPYFIDDFGTACAVGHLILHSDYAELSHRISRENNYAYVKDLLVYEDLITWADEAGFTADELAWIQPAYWEPAPNKWETVGQGTNGTINVSVKDVVNNVVYFGGAFTEVDGTPNINNIFAYNGSSFTQLGDGLNGEVTSMALFDGKLYAAGSFTASGNNAMETLAVWDGSSWQGANNGIYGGMVNALEVFDGKLYAAGDFIMGIVPVADVHLAVFDNGVWAPAGVQVNGTAMEMVAGNSLLYIGGDFDSLGTDVVNSVYAWDGKQVKITASPPYSLQVDAMCNYLDQIIIAGSRYDTAGMKKTDLLRLNGSKWDTLASSYSYAIIGYFNSDTVEVHSLKVEDSTLLVTGNFTFTPYSLQLISNSIIGKNVCEIAYTYLPNFGYNFISKGLINSIDGEVNTAVMFNEGVLIGGAFSNIDNLNDPDVNAKSLAATGVMPVGIPIQPYASTLKVLNSLTGDRAYIDLEGYTSQHLQLSLHSTDGRQVRSLMIDQSTNRVAIPKGELSSGLYLYNLYDGEQLLGRGKIVFQ